jgi:hypothetical protein
MKSIPSLSFIALAALVIGAECRNKTTIFAPSLMPNTDRHDPSHIYPSSSVSMHYASNMTAVGNTHINVTHAMKYPAVLLEQSKLEQSFAVSCNGSKPTQPVESIERISKFPIRSFRSFPLQAVLSNANCFAVASISSVNCSANSVAITFNDSSIFEATEAAWSAEVPLVLVTNHLGDCDVELERGIFLVKSLTWNNASLVATANSQVANVSSVASKFFANL